MTSVYIVYRFNIKMDQDTVYEVCTTRPIAEKIVKEEIKAGVDKDDFFIGEHYVVEE